MEFFDVIARRGSYRGEFKQSSISQEELYRILDAGIRAPSGYNLQTATFYAVTDELLRRCGLESEGVPVRWRARERASRGS